MRRILTILTLVLTLTAWAPSSPAAAQDDDSPTLTLSGFVSASVFAQDQSFGFGNGQSAVWAMPDRVDRDNWFMGGDVRNTRLRLTLDQEVEETPVQAVVEADFFGAFNGAGPFSDEQPQPRLRLAYVDLNLGGTLLRVGQMFTPLMGNVPTSLSHIAFPLGIASGGVVGWRHPGVLVKRELTSGDGLGVAVQAGAFRGSWSGPGTNLDQQSAGEAGSIPQLEVRVDVRGAADSDIAWSGYVVGHYDRKDLDGIGVGPEDPDELEGIGLQAGGAIGVRGIGLKGNAYWGRALGHQFGQLGQFGDIEGWGAWVQAEVPLAPRWDAALFLGHDDPRNADVVREVAGAGRIQNTTTAAMARYTLGTYAIAIEAIRATTAWCGSWPNRPRRVPARAGPWRRRRFLCPAGAARTSPPSMWTPRRLRSAISPTCRKACAACLRASTR